MRWILTGLLAAIVAGRAQVPPVPLVPESPTAAGKRALAMKDYARAKMIFGEYSRAHPNDVQAELGWADAELGLKQYEPAELHYRHVVAMQPLLWAAHKNLVIIEAALGRWEDFDGERAVLRAARERGDAGLNVRDIDVIDVITARGQRWIVRDYFEPLGRFRTRYNFERFSADGHVLAYVSLESADALRGAVTGAPVVVGNTAKRETESAGFSLNWYNGKSHGTIARYAVEPKYEQVRAAFLKWLASV